MASPTQGGQALPEYLLMLAVLLLMALSGARLFRATLGGVENAYAIQFMLPSP
jgi:hypothetical protein